MQMDLKEISRKNVKEIEIFQDMITGLVFLR
jgi:hypothetical protein